MSLTEQQLDSLLKEVDLPIKLHPEKDRVRRFDHLADLSEFIDAQFEYWKSARAGSLQRVRDDLRTLRGKLRGVLSNENYDAARRELDQLKSFLNSSERNWVFSDTKLGEFLHKLDSVDPSAAEAAARFATNRMPDFSGQLWNHPSYIKGILAYIYQMEPNFLDATAQSQVDAVDRFIRELDSERENLHKKYEAATAAASKTQVDTSTRAEEHLKTSGERFEGAFSKWESDLETYFKTQQARLEALEVLYKERVRLLKPAEYWGSLTEEYDKKGEAWVLGAVASSIALVGFATLLLYEPPRVFEAAEVTLSGIKGALIATAALSMLIYFTHLCVRVAVSSFHLARDARERQQLTHVFLALLDEEPLQGHDKEMVKAERAIVYQALFSRADTGLLKSDGAPTMPGPLANLAEVFRGKSG